MKRNMQAFLHRRAELLAFVHLTRRDDVVVDRLAAADFGVDYLVSLAGKGVPPGRIFGVQVKAIDGCVANPGDLDGAPRLRIERQHLAAAPLPLLLFVFTMHDDRGFYGWLKEPVVGADGVAVLRPVDSIHWKDLNDGGLDEILAAVNDWYDARPYSQAA
jgi:hypothetical protein